VIARIVGAIDRLQFHQKLRLAPTVAAVALGLIFATNLLLGVAVQRQQARIQRGYYPSVQLSGQLTELLSSTQRALQDAAAANDPERLAVADSLRDVMLAAMRTARGNIVMERDAIDGLQSTYTSYYQLARATRRSPPSAR
jgi:hypothetical protein